MVSWEKTAAELGQEGTHIWNENCEACGGDGRVHLCYACNLVYHPRCLVEGVLGRRGLKPHEELLCPECAELAHKDEVYREEIELMDEGRIPLVEAGEEKGEEKISDVEEEIVDPNGASWGQGLRRSSRLAAQRR